MSIGKLIVIDGIDGSGKGTQVSLLVKKLKSKGVKAEALDFPQYQSFFGQLIGRYLLNEFGRLSPYVASVLYAANRFEFKDKLMKMREQGRVIVLNRYVSANQIHQASEIKSKSKRDAFVKWIARMEYEIFGLPRPDLTIFLKVPPKVAVSMIAQKTHRARKYAKGAKMDLLESDLEHQTKALHQSFQLAKSSKAYLIECVSNNKILSKEEISQKIWQVVAKLIK